MAQTGIEELKKAVFERARRLAQESREQAHRQREQIIHEENERLRLREEREVLYAKELAERVYRRKVQASALRVRGDLDRLRWEMIQRVLESVKARLEEFASSDEDYEPIFKALLSRAAHCIPGNELVAELNERDLARFSSEWDGIVREAVPDKQVQLADKPLKCIGGVRLSDTDEQIRVDNTLDGRMERFRDELNEIVQERVFGHALTIGDLMHG